MFKREFPNSQFKSTRTLSYLERDGDDMPIVFLHGSGFSKEVFARQFNSKKLTNHRLLAVDLPGHGQSKDAENSIKTYSYAGLAKEILAFVSEKKISNCIVAGWSLGGQIALEMIDNTPLVSGIMAFGAAPAPNGPLGLIQSMHISRILLLAGKAEFTRADAQYFEDACFGKLTNQDFVDTLLRTDRRMRPSISRSVLYGYGLSQKARLEDTKTPVCLLHGRNDPLIKTTYMESLSNPLLFSGKTVIVDNSGHAPFMDAQAEFDTILQNFTEAVASGAMEACRPKLSQAS